MDLEELKKRREALDKSVEITTKNMDTIINETLRVADVAHNGREILDDLDRKFEQQAGLQGYDIPFLFVATALQLTRIFLVNELTKIEKAGMGNVKEENFHQLQEQILKKLYDGKFVDERPFYASMEHIVTTPGVPYDAQNSFDLKTIERLLDKDKPPAWNFDIKDYLVHEKLNLFKGANHRFSTLGHDPILGLVFGTANVMTNTITCTKQVPVLGPIGIPVLTSNHVIYTSNFKDPRIGIYTPTTMMLYKSMQRIKEQPEVLVASLIKQIIHIGTDLYTPKGIQFPGANLVLSNTNIERITKYISTGDIIKVGSSASLASLINLIISTVHTLLCRDIEELARDVYNARTKKIILYSNTIATSSNIIWVGANVAAGDKTQLRNLDIGGLMVTVKRLLTDPAYIRKIKEEFIFGQFDQLIQGDDLNLQEVDLFLGEYHEYERKPVKERQGKVEEFALELKQTF